MRLSFVGELGWELHVPNQSSVPVYRAIHQAGSQHGLVNAGYRAIDSLSIEKGFGVVTARRRDGSIVFSIAVFSVNTITHEPLQLD